MNLHGHIFQKVAAIVLSALALYGCGDGIKSPDSSFSGYISAYTGGIVSGDDAIVIELAAPAENIQGTEAEISEAATRLFRFSPSLDGTARWISPQRVEFTPADGALKAGKTYTCRFRLGEVAATDRQHKEFTFSFMTAPKEARLAEESLSISASDRNNATVTGTLTLSENIDISEPAELLAFDWSGTKATFDVKATDGKTLAWTASGLERSDEAKTLKVSFNPGRTGFRKCDGLDIPIPAKGTFSVLGARMSEGSDAYIDITFSEPLDRSQSLSGLVSLSGASENVTTSVTDNRIRLYYETDGEEALTLEIEGAVKDIDGDRLGESWMKTFSAGSPKPEVRFPIDGNILPDAGHLVVPFCAANLNAVDISIIKIYTSNILMFLQENDLQGDSGLRRAGRLIYKTTMRLDGDPSADLTKMRTYTIGLDKLFKKESGALYRMRITFRPEYYIYHNKGESGSGDGGLVSIDTGSLTEEESAVWDDPYPYYYDGSAYDWSKYRWQDRNNPLTPSYYMDYDFPSRNLMTSDIGVTAKYGESGRIWVGASDIISAEPISGAEINVYNYQLQTIGKGKSSSDGMTEVNVSGKPFIVTVKKGSSVTYLKMTDGSEKSLSRFDTGGESLQKGLKGFIYGERGVWRPGDTLHLTMILHSDEKIPDSHPASIDVYTPQGQFFTRKVCRHAENGFYTFDIPTTGDCPTGLWDAYVKVGGATFHKSLRIETIKPNMLKVNVDMGEKLLRGGSTSTVRIAAAWLTGPAASGLQANVSMTLKPGRPDFKGYEKYTFTDPASDFTGFTTELLRARLDKDGKAAAAVTLPNVPQAPGMLSASVLGSVTEDGGDESYSALIFPYSPFSAYVGVAIPDGESYLETGRTHKIPVALVDAAGKAVSGHRLEWRIFKLKWSWWWESRKDPLDSYVNASAASAVSSGAIVSNGGKMSIPFNADDKDWGRYLIYIKDLDGGHSSGGIVYADSYSGRSDRNDPDAPAMLSFSLDKKSYKTGETATVYIPAAENGRALVSIEKGGRVLKSEWVRTSGASDTQYKIKTESDMAPNFYVHITLVQPYRNSANDLPLRMYGVQPVMVESEASHIEPVISMPDRLHPEEPFTIKVSERNGRPMTYTLAIVDDGLLDLTAFKTPDPWNYMYRREALGVRTWDMYDNVFGASGSTFSAMLSIGGDEGLIKGARKENRFNPVVKVLGPFTLKSGSKSHRITLPMYVGSVRTMVVAGYDGAYGSTSKTTPVTSPVMILPTLPRVAGCGEKLTLPVNVFVMEGGIGKVNVSVHCEGPLSVAGQSGSSLEFSGTGDKMIRFALAADKSKTGTAKVTVTAEGGGHRMTETIAIEVRNPSPQVISTEGILLGKGESKTFRYQPSISGNGDEAYIEAFGYPSIGWNSLFSYMESYPHSCTEQLAAKGLSLLYSMRMLSPDNAEKAKKMVPGILSALYSRQLQDGGFAYWPGESHSDEWVTSMAGELMAVARNQGYAVNSGVSSKWLKFQKRCVQNWRTSKVYELSDLTQAYRLYTMALSGNSDEAAMNRMKESGSLSWQAAMMLSSTYSLCGKKNVGADIIRSLSDSPEEWSRNAQTFGTPLRDKAIALEATVLSGNVQGAVVYANGISGEDASGLRPWSMSTQESAFISRAMSRLAENVTGRSVSIDVSDGTSDVRALVSRPSENGMVKAGLKTDTGEVSVKNTSEGPAYIRLTTVSQPAAGEHVEAKSSGIRLSVTYIGPDGSAMSPATVRQGTEFTAVIRVSNPSQSDDLRNMALTEMIPSGWEIVNERMTGQDLPSAGRYDYLDIRDDRDIFYFSIPRGTYKEFRVRLRAAYEGRFVLPSVTCEAMYDSSIYARTASGVAEVTR